MTLEELVAAFRSKSLDNVMPYLSDDDEVKAWFNEAEEEAALRANLLFDSTTTAVCQIAVTAGTAVYPLHSRVFQVTRASFTPAGETEPIELALTGRVEQDRVHPGWRTLSKPPAHLIVDDTQVQLACLPDTDGTLDLEVYRAPLVPMVDDADSPEIGRAHHRFLTHWALHRHFEKPDDEILNPGRSGAEEALFTRQFGIRPDAALRRDFQADTPAHNVAW